MAKRCLVIRHGAYGDAIQASCVLPYIQKDGYEITFYGNTRAEEVLRHNPRISKWIMHDEEIPIEKLEKHWEKIGKGYDKVVNLTGVIENNLLFAYPQANYFKSLEERRRIVNKKNYFDAHIERAGYKPDKPKAEIYFTAEEKKKANSLRHHGKTFKIAWALSGSSINKVYRYFEPVCRTFLRKHSDAVLFTLGDFVSKLLTFESPQVVNTMVNDELSYREAMLVTKYSDLVIGPETGLLMAAGCFKVPKILFATHSYKEQITKYWENDYSIQAECECSPCHLLHKYKDIWKDVCKTEKITVEEKSMNVPVCTMSPEPQKLLNRMEEIYNGWRNKV